MTDAVPCPTSLPSWHVYSPASVFKTDPMVSDGVWTVPSVYLESVTTLMTSWPFFHVTLVTAGLAPCIRHVMVTDCPSTTGSGVTTDTVGLSTTCIQQSFVEICKSKCTKLYKIIYSINYVGCIFNNMYILKLHLYPNLLPFSYESFNRCSWYACSCTFQVANVV